MQKTRTQSPCPRRGIILPLAAVCLVFVIAFSALTIDLGFVIRSRHEAQNCADAAAMAAAGELYPSMLPQTAIKLPLALPIYQPARPYPQVTKAINASKVISAANRCGDRNGLTLLDSDISFGIYDRGTITGPTPTLPLVDGLLSLLNLRTADHTFVNACTVTVRRDVQANQPLSLFFSPVLGKKSHSFKSTATAAIQRGYGLRAGDKLLPFAMDITIWNALRFTNGELNAVTLQPLGINLDALNLTDLLGATGLLSILNKALPLALSGSPIHILDGYTFERGMRTVAAGPDGINEIVLLGDQLHVVSLPGILGIIISTVKRIPSLMVTLETGASAGGIPDANRLNSVIRNGLTETDLYNLTGSSSGELWLPFTMKSYFEIPTACEADLIAIIGQPRIMPLYATLPGTVNKVTDILGFPHHIQMVGWVGVVVTEVNLHGPVRFINVQPAVYARHTIMPATGSKAHLPSTVMSDGSKPLGQEQQHPVRDSRAPGSGVRRGQRQS